MRNRFGLSLVLCGLCSALSACGASTTSMPGDKSPSQALPLSAVVRGTTEGGENVRQPSCAPPGGVERELGFHASEAGWYRFSVEADYDAVLMAYRNGIEVACNDDGETKRTSELSLELSAGELITLVVDGYGHTQGTFRILAEPGSEPVPEHVSGILALDQQVEGATTGASDHFAPACGSASGSADQVWHFVPEEAGRYRFRVSAQYDSVLALFDEEGGALGCNDDFRGTSSSQLDHPLEAGETYQVVVDGYQSNQGSYTLVATRLSGGGAAQPGTPGGGVLTVGQPVSHATTGSTDRFTPTCGANPGSPDHVWEFSPTEAGTLELILEAQYDGVLAVYDAQGTEVVCNDDDGPNRSIVVLGVVAGQTYRVVVDGYQGGQGAYTLRAQPQGAGPQVAVPPSADGNLAPRQAIQDATTGSPDRLQPSCGSRPGTPDDIWEFRASRRGRYRFHVDSQYDAVLAVYDENWNEIACNDDHQSTNAAEITTRLSGRQQVYIVVDGFGASTGSYTLTGRRLSKRER